VTAGLEERTPLFGGVLLSAQGRRRSITAPGHGASFPKVTLLSCPVYNQSPRRGRRSAARALTVQLFATIIWDSGILIPCSALESRTQRLFRNCIERAPLKFGRKTHRAIWRLCDKIYPCFIQRML
jgi:hypothetical protein